MPPVNDNIADAITLTVGDGVLGPYTIDDATTEGGEPSTGGSSNNSVWFRFTTIGSGTVHLSTFGSLAGDADSGDGLPHGPFGSLDTVMAVWTGSSFPTGLHSNNDDSATDPEEGYWSELTIGVAPGTTYWVQVGTFDPDYVGTVVLSWEGVPSSPDEPPPPPPEPCLTYPTWGSAFNGEGPSSTPGGGEAAGYVEAGLTNLIFENDPPDGALLIAVVERYSYAGGSPPTGTLAGFGATWTQLNTQTAAGNLGVAFSEIWWAREATYSSGRLRYTFPAGSDYDKQYSFVGYQAFVGVDPAQPFLNLEEYGPNAGTSASYSHAAALVTPSSLLFSAFFQMDSSGSDAGISTSSWLSAPIGGGHETPPLLSGGLPVPVDPQRGNGAIAGVATGPDFAITFNDGSSRTWWAMTLEIVADPECATVAYWGINATTPA